MKLCSKTQCTTFFWTLCICSVSPLNVHLFIFWITVKNSPILITFVVLNPEKIWHKHLMYLSTSPVRCSHFTLRNAKKVLSLLFIYLRLLTLAQKNKSSHCCTAALAVYLLMFSGCCYVHSHSTHATRVYWAVLCTTVVHSSMSSSFS